MNALNISAIVLDIDGTLLTSKEQLEDTTLLALQKCVQNGIELYLATARPRRLVFRPHETQKDITFLTEKGVFYNGAFAMDKSLNYSKHRNMSKKLVKAIIDSLIDYNIDFQIAIQYKEDYHSFRYPLSNSALKGWGFTQEELLPFSEASRRECSKVVVWHDSRNLINVYQNLINQYNNRVNIFLTDSEHCMLITESKASKENALIELFSLRNIDQKNVVAFGDAAPDMGMFKTFGYSIAMANASESLKEISTYVTRSNDDDGIAYAIEKYLGIK